MPPVALDMPVDSARDTVAELSAAVMPYAPLRRTMTPLGRVFGVTPWWLASGISASNCVAAYAPKGAASQSASYTNLANPGTYTLIETSAPSWSSAVGWTFTGTATLDTGISPTAGCSMIVRLTGGPPTSNGRAFAASDANIFTINVTGCQWTAGGNSSLTTTAISSACVLAIANKTAYKDGSSVGSIPGGTMPSATIFLGNNFAGSRPLGMNIVAVAYYNIDIASYISALTTAMNAL